MSRLKDKRFQGLIVTAVCGLALLVACSTDSPTAPLQVPPPPTDGGGPDAWNITVTASPSVLVAGEDQPSTISIQIRDRATGANPPPGSTVALSTTIGEFGFSGSEATSAAAVIDLGRASALLFPPDFAGNATVTATYGGSRGSTNVQIGTGDVFVSSVSPSSGPEAGGTSVTIKGVGFFGALRVVFGTGNGSVSSVASDGTSIRAKTPPFTGAFNSETCEKSGVTGKRYLPTAVDVKIESSAGSTASLTGGFIYNPKATGCDTSGGGG